MVRLAALLVLSSSLFAANQDFSGTWILGNQRLVIAQQDSFLRCSSGDTHWTYNLNGEESRYRIGAEARNSVAKWQGAALLINTLVSGPNNYTEMDRWQLSRDGNVLTIRRQTVSARGTDESSLVYYREGYAPPSPPHPPATVSSTPAPRTPAPAPLRREPPRQSDYLIATGTHIPLALRNTVDTKHSHEGDHIYLETIQPIAADGRVVIPRGSYVNGHVTQSKPGGVLKGKGELYIVFDALVLPNGTSRDFRARLASADASAQGKVDSKEGKVTGERDTSGEARGTAEGAGIGAAVGGIAGSAAGHPITGLGVGAGAGAAAGLASVLVKHRPDAALPKGTVVDMVLDRDLHFNAAELPF
jgi:type IV secretion system protein VirB10